MATQASIFWAPGVYKALLWAVLKRGTLQGSIGAWGHWRGFLWNSPPAFIALKARECSLGVAMVWLLPRREAEEAGCPWRTPLWPSARPWHPWQITAALHSESACPSDVCALQAGKGGFCQGPDSRWEWLAGLWEKTLLSEALSVQTKRSPSFSKCLCELSVPVCSFNLHLPLPSHNAEPSRLLLILHCPAPMSSPLCRLPHHLPTHLCQGPGSRLWAPTSYSSLCAQCLTWAQK